MAVKRPADPVKGASGLSESDPLRRLRRREISLDEYLDVCVDRAVRHLVGIAPPERLTAAKEILRQQLASDPVLVEYVRQTTGLDSRSSSEK